MSAPSHGRGGANNSSFAFMSDLSCYFFQICEVFELVKSLWHCKCNDQLSSLLSENKYATILYSFLSLPEYSDQVRVGVAEVIRGFSCFYITFFKIGVAYAVYANHVARCC